MTAQPDMFRDYVPYIRDSETSRMAAEAIKHDTPALRDLVLSAFRRAGFVGLTDGELFAQMVAAGFHGAESTIRARRIELTKRRWAVEKLRYPYPPLKDSGGRRKEQGARTPSTVWICAEIKSGEVAA